MIKDCQIANLAIFNNFNDFNNNLNKNSKDNDTKNNNYLKFIQSQQNFNKNNNVLNLPLFQLYAFNTFNSVNLSPLNNINNSIFKKKLENSFNNISFNNKCGKENNKSYENEGNSNKKQKLKIRDFLKEQIFIGNKNREILSNDELVSNNLYNINNGYNNLNKIAKVNCKSNSSTTWSSPSFETSQKQFLPCQISNLNLSNNNYNENESNNLIRIEPINEQIKVKDVEQEYLENISIKSQKKLENLMFILKDQKTNEQDLNKIFNEDNSNTLLILKIKTKIGVFDLNLTKDKSFKESIKLFILENNLDLIYLKVILDYVFKAVLILEDTFLNHQDTIKQVYFKSSKIFNEEQIIYKNDKDEEQSIKFNLRKYKDKKTKVEKKKLILNKSI